MLQEDLSPRSDEDVDLDIYKGALENPYDLLRNHTFFKEEFILEETRPKDPLIQSSSSGSDTVSSSNSSHVSTPRDKILSMETKTALRTGKTLTNNFKQPNKIIGAKSVGMSLNVSKQKLNAKSVPTVKENNDSSKGVTVLTAMAMKNAAVLAANGNSKTASESKTKPGVTDKKTGGTIIIHGDVDNNKVTSEVNEKANNNKNCETIAVPKENIESKECAKSTEGASSKVNSVSANSAKPVNAVKTEPNKTVKSAREVKGKTASKDSQPLHVVPTKLTANAINKNVPKSGVDKVDEKSKPDNSDDTTTAKKTAECDDINKTENKTVSNVKMELSPSARVASRVNTPQNENKTVSKVTASSTSKPVSSGNNNLPVQSVPTVKGNDKSQTVKASNNDIEVSGSKTEKESTVSTTDNNTPAGTANKNKQSSSAQLSNRQVNSPARNPTFTVSKSAGAYQRATAGSRKSTPNFTPTFSSVQKSSADLKNNDNNTAKGVNPKLKPAQEKTAASTVVKPQSNANVANMTEQNENEEKTKKPSSPSEINLAPGVCRSSSMLKSYNMASSANGGNKSGSQPKTPRSSSKLSSNVNSKDSKGQSSSVQGVGNAQNSVNNSKDNKMVVDSKSTSVASVNVVSKSISQMPLAANVNKTKSGSAGMSRSVSMSLIEECTEDSVEKQKMSSSDTKVQNHAPNSSKQRPLSDGSIAANSNSPASDKVLKSNGKAPLIDILPSNSPRLSKTNYMETTPKMSTPVIVNPFEELEKNREKENQLKLGARGITATEFGYVVEKPGPERSKTQTSLKSKNLKSGKKAGYGKETKPSSASTRGSSGRSRRAKSKESKPDDGRPKSGKANRRVRSGKRKRKVPGDNLSKQNEKADIALIGGIGWHVATSCRDKSDADAVIVSQIDSSDFSEDECEVLRVSPLPFDNPYALNIPNHPESSSALSSPRFMELKSSNVEKSVLPAMENDGFPPMNLDMTQMSNSASNPDMEKVSDPAIAVPDDIAALLAKLKAQENAENDNDESNDETTSNTYQQLTSAIHREILKGNLTPIPESPGVTRTQSSLQHIAKTVEAITKFDENLKEEDLNRLLGVTPRDKNGSISSKVKHSVNQEFQCETISNPSNKSGALPKRPPPPKISSAGKPSQSNKGMVHVTSDSSRASSRNNSSKGKQYSDRQTPVSSADRHDRGITFSNRQQTPVTSADQSSRVVTPKQPLSMSFNSNILNEIQNNAIMETSKMVDTVNKAKERDIKPETKERKSSAASSSSDSKSESAKLDLRTLLTEKMQSTKRMLEETTNSLKSRSWRNKRKISVEDTENITSKSSDATNVYGSQGFEVKVNDNDKESGNNTAREDGEIQTSRSSRKERKFSEDKSTVPDDENIDNVIDEILSNTYPSAKSKSIKSANSTLTEADRHLLKQMANHKEGSPFYAKQHIRESSSYDDSLTLNKDNPHLMKRFHADKLQMGQKVKAMLDAGADKTKVKAMLDVDNEAKQLAKIMNSFRHMELYAGPHGGISNRSAKKETPRNVDSLSRLEQTPVALMSHRLPGRPGSAGAGKIKPGKFTEIKEGSRSTQAQDRPVSPPVVPQVSYFVFLFT